MQGDIGDTGMGAMEDNTRFPEAADGLSWLAARNRGRNGQNLWAAVDP